MTHNRCVLVLAALSSLACSEDTKSAATDAGSGGGTAETGGATSSGGAKSTGGVKSTGGATSGGANSGSGGKSAGSGGNGAGGKATAAGGSNAGTGGRSSGGGSGAGGKAGSGGAAEPLDAGAADASMACVTYCKCMAMNCASQIFPTGCLKECAAGTKWDMECRQGMCSLAPAQPANNHCIHAFGVNECLDKP